MKHSFGQRSLLLATMFVIVIAASAGFTKKIRMKCYDQHGTFLLTDSIVQPISDCFFLIPPKIPYYVCATYDPNGSSACLIGGELNVEYKALGLTGFDKLTQQPIEIQDNMSFVITEQRNDVTYVWAAKPNEHSMLSVIPMKDATHDPTETWVFERGAAGWYLHNEATGLFVSGISEKGELSMSEDPVDFLLQTSRVTGEPWKITELESQRSYSFVPRHYAVRPFFKLQENFIDDKYNEIAASRESYVKAGDTFALAQKNIQDYAYEAWKLDDNATDESTTLPKMESQHTVDYVYKHVTAIPSLRKSVGNLSPVDLSGRRVSPDYRGWVVVNGRVKWQ